MTPISVHLATKDVVDFAAPYGIAGAQVDGNDVLAVRAVTHDAVERAREGEGPTLLECKTYRWHGHYEGDPESYRDKSEVARWREADPLVRLRTAVMDDAALTAEFGMITEAVRREVEAAVEWAAADAEPELSSIFANVYRDPSPFIRNSAHLRSTTPTGGEA